MNGIRVLAFDVFGTVVDWHASIAAEVAQMLPDVDADAFALAWRDGYRPAMAKVNAGALGWTLIDDLHRMILDDVLRQFDVTTLGEERIRYLNKAWHRLAPWPDSVEGLTRLKTGFTVCTLSNGNLGLLSNLAKHGGLPWDCILSAEVFHKYKPHPETYLGVARIFDLRPDEVMMVAAHQDDLDAARACGLKTAYIERPHEFGRTRPKDVSDSGRNTCHAKDIATLAAILGT